MCHGLIAYSERQAALLKFIADGHANHWLPELKSKEISPDWAVRYSTKRAVAIVTTQASNFADKSSSDKDADSSEDSSDWKDDLIDSNHEVDK